MPAPSRPAGSGTEVPRRLVITPPLDPGKRIRSAAHLGPKQVLALLLAPAIVALFTAMIVSQAPYLTWFLVPTVALLCGLALWGLWSGIGFRHGRLEVVTADGRLWFPSSRALPLVATGGLFLLTVVWVLLLVGVLEGSVDLSTARSGWRDGNGLLLAGFITVPLLVSRLRRRTVDHRLGLGPVDVLHLHRDGPCVVAWNHVQRVELSSDRGPHLQLTAWGRVESGYTAKPLASTWRVRGVPDGRDWIAVPLNAFRSDPALMELVLQFYRRHPGYRHELGTAAAEERIARGDFGPDAR